MSNDVHEKRSMPKRLWQHGGVLRLNITLLFNSKPEQQTLKSITSHHLVSVCIQDDTEEKVNIMEIRTSLQARLIYLIGVESNSLQHRPTKTMSFP